MNKFEEFPFDDHKYVVYVLRSETKKNMMYCGMTNDFRRRIRQHNGEIKGGGKYTSANRPWKLAALIPIKSDLEDAEENNKVCKSKALKVEYWTKAKNYPLQGFEGKEYTRPPKKAIPRDDAVTRRVWLVRETLRKHKLPEPFWFDEEFEECWNLLKKD
jgi:predicted GIY-YIG superfamily endonuclease